MQLDKSHIIVMIGGAIATISVFLAWSDSLNMIDLASFLEKVNGSFIDGISPYLRGVFLVFAVCGILEPLLDAYSNKAYDGKFGVWTIINGIVILVIAALFAVRINDLSLGFGIGCILAFVGAIVFMIGGVMAAKKV